MSSELFEEKLAREWTDRDARAMLREQGFDAELGARQKTLRGVTPLHATARAGHLDQLKWLGDKGADVKALDVLHNSPLHECCRGGDYASLEFIIEVIFAAGGGVDDEAPACAACSTCISACQNMSIRAIRFASGGCVAKSSETPSAKNM